MNMLNKLGFITTHRNMAMILLCAISAGALAQTARRRGPIVRQVDQILIESGNPKALFSFFTDDLKLPIAWPMAAQKGYVSGGVSAGNIILEIFQYTDRNGGFAKAQARYSGLAFEPYPLSNALTELQTSRIPFNPPEPQYSPLPDGSRGVSLTRVTLPSFSNAGFSVFLYEYSPSFLQVEVRRKQLGNRLTLNDGGPLGLQSVREIVIVTGNLKKRLATWNQLLGNPYSPGIWRIGSGPEIRLVEGQGADRIQELILEVKYLDRAKAFLRKKGMLSPGGSSLNPAIVQQLRINLAESPKTDRGATLGAPAPRRQK